MNNNVRSLNIASSVASCFGRKHKTNRVGYKMDLNIKKDLASNWFKLIQNAVCNDILKLEKKKYKI